MSEDQHTAIDGALLAFHQIECMLGFIRRGLDDRPDAADALSGLEILCVTAADRLETIKGPME